MRNRDLVNRDLSVVIGIEQRKSFFQAIQFVSWNKEERLNNIVLWQYLIVDIASDHK